MTDRRRNLFILLLVAGLLVGSMLLITSKETKLGLDLRGGVELVYEASPTPQQPTVDAEAIDRAIEVMRERVDRLGVAEPEIQRSGNNQISVGLPDVANVDEALDQVGQVAQLYFYDWEPNVIGPDGRPAPDDESVTGGQGAGDPAAGMTQYEAVQLASERPGIKDGNNSHEGVFYAIDEKEKKVLAGPQETRKELEDTLEDRTQPTTREETRLTQEVVDRAKIVEVKEGTVIVRAEQDDELEQEDKLDSWFVLADNVALRGTDVTEPEQNFDSGPGSSGQPIVTFKFTDKGRDIWERVTKEIAERGQRSRTPGQVDPLVSAQHFAIVLDDELISTPYIDYEQNPNGIDAANGSQIEGGFTIETAQELANLLKTGALPVKLDLISQSQVSATLGEQALDEGLVAGGAALGIVALFLLVFYRVLGVIAILALGVYGVYFYALIKLIPITMTLPGIAGTILTLGVAADANIVIFERVKEEIRGGKSVMSGLATGYKKGLGAIIDANVVTIMVAFILFVLATSGVKGFAFTLGVGTLVSLFTAVLFTQAIVGTMGRTKLMASPSALGAGKQARPITFDFMGWSKWFFSMSGVILLICAIALAGKGLDFGIDFESGTRFRVALEQKADEGQIRDVMAGVGQADAEIQRVEDPALGENGFQISTEQIAPDETPQVTNALEEEFGFQSAPNTQSIGPTFGETVANSAIIAVIASLLVISVYLALRFEWKYAAPVLIALSHDLLITTGVYALVGREVTTSTVAALLTILGFSLYDTIIVFDRIRENVPRMPRATYSQIVNRSMSEVIVRSLATTLTAGLPVLALMLFGGETLQDFAFALLVGTISGTYSSVFIASQVLTHWKEREPMWRRRRALIAGEHGGLVPAYAAGAAATVVDVEEPRRPRRGLSADDPQRGVSREEFDEMVRDLHPDTPPARTAVQDPPAPAPDVSRDADPSELYMKDDSAAKRRSKSQRKPKNRKHGRPR